MCWRRRPLRQSLVVLGGHAGSNELQEWASRELRGYAGTGVELPAYRRPGAVLQVDAVKRHYQITGQPISPRALPEGLREHIGEEVRLGQLEQLAAA